MKTNPLTPQQTTGLLATLQARFEQHTQLHPTLSWPDVQARLQAAPHALAALQQMELSGGEPDVVGRDEISGAYLFMDCSPETPAGRRNLCYDRAALDARKANKPASSAMETAEAWGAMLLDEEHYRHLQSLGEFDLKTSSWLLTPASVRKLGGALFGDRRYGRVFIYHNGADSYYGVRGFRVMVRV
ncbi:hypothetical protein SDC9_107899 [bioreactor metagenome]|uniref:DUF4256 domain-containing protein n=1 Tax=bioreactor metagenome TaxID=1076179 RepID=A0A645B6I3_9ZZZZ